MSIFIPGHDVLICLSSLFVTDKICATQKLKILSQLEMMVNNKHIRLFTADLKDSVATWVQKPGIVSEALTVNVCSAHNDAH